MGKCIIICPLWQGERIAELTPAEDDLLLTADAGYYAAVNAGLAPALAIGDFDTLPPPEDKTGTRILPVKKDDTDLGLCIREGRERGFRSFLLAGCLGGRLDHTFAMLQLMTDCALRGESCTALDSVNTVTILGPGTHRIPKGNDTLLSLLSFTEKVEGVCLEGTEWPLDHAVLSQRNPLGISNRITGAEAVLRFERGLLLVCRSVNDSWLEKTASPLV